MAPSQQELIINSLKELTEEIKSLNKQIKILSDNITGSTEKMTDSQPISGEEHCVLKEGEVFEDWEKDWSAKTDLERIAQKETDIKRVSEENPTTGKIERHVVVSPKINSEKEETLEGWEKKWEKKEERPKRLKEKSVKHWGEMLKRAEEKRPKFYVEDEDDKPEENKKDDPEIKLSETGQLTIDADTKQQEKELGDMDLKRHCYLRELNKDNPGIELSKINRLARGGDPKLWSEIAQKAEKEKDSVRHSVRGPRKEFELELSKKEDKQIETTVTLPQYETTIKKSPS